MKLWTVACDSCPYRHRFENQSEAHQAMAQHATENPQHNPRVTEEER